jgi:hypothetical protein
MNEYYLVVVVVVGGMLDLNNHSFSWQMCFMWGLL